MSLGTGIKLSTGFDLNSKSPLDNRTQVNTIQERDAIPYISLYDGLECYVVEQDIKYKYVNGEWIDCFEELKIALAEKIDDVILDGNVLAFYADGVLKRTIELPSRSAKAICGEFVCGELNVGEGLEVNKLSDDYTEWIDGETPVNAFNMNKIEEKLRVLESEVSQGSCEVYMGENEPEDRYKIWIDTSDANNVVSRLEDDLLDEFRSIFAFMQSEINSLKNKNLELETRIEYLELHGGGGGITPPDDTDGIILTFEDGSIMTFEDGSIMTFEDGSSLSTLMTFEDNSIMTFEDGSIMIFEDEEVSSNTLMTFEDNSVMTFEDNNKMIFE